MSSSARKLEFQPSVATSVRVDRSRFYVLLANGREISAPLDRSHARATTPAVTAPTDQAIHASHGTT